MLQKIIRTDNSRATIIIRLMVGTVFLSEGLQKFLFPALRGAGRMEKIGLPAADFLGGFVGTFEVLCGILVLLGFLTRLAGVPLVAIMLIAITTTKREILLNEGFWEMMHAGRTDWAMLLGSFFLIVKGGGLWSVDKMVSKNGG
ncbi:DoxX family protein [Sinomicrobium pectinilyticum]|uniref:DoxX family protein n=1 Tax=Sinomicrobium pectinilyticum TaxID=1084421 RepID=A0A3N0EH73_SINP1|nr:DoxX family protein [Sinomicrobium pectinilyticum]RNL87134.1 DoxX family protein [Sinomicrobium pectinilyticum]